MNSLISINAKFMSLTPKELIELLKPSKYLKGLEVYIDRGDNDYGLSTSYQLDYLDKLVYELKKNNLLLQIHGNIELDLEEQVKFIKKIEEYSDYLEYPIIFTLHTKFIDNPDESLKKTNEYIEELLKNIDTEKVVVCIENLNDCEGINRLEKEYLKPLVLNNEKLYFTYDIGHELFDFGEITNLDKYMIEKLKNVHIHTFNLSKADHMPIYKNDMNWNKIIKSITYLKTINYNENVVFEYDLNKCIGNSVDERINDYIKSIDLVSEYI